MIPIDAVITWVDGNDPDLKKKRDSWLTEKHEDKSEDIAGPSRYSSSGELFFCVASILKFAPFIRRIFIVTDGQDPHLDNFIRRNFPDTETEIRIIDHTDIFRGYEQYLPTFNSLAIETMLYRIPDLSEYFIYFNDDLFLTSPVTEDDFVHEGKTVAYGYMHLTSTAWACRLLGRLKRHSTFKFRDSMLNAALIAGGRASWKFIRISHTPHVLRKSICEKFYAGHPDMMLRNIRHKFRDKEQFNPQTLFHTMSYYGGQCILRSEKNVLIYLHSSAEREEQTRKDIDNLRSSREARFCCINSFGEATQEQKNELVSCIGDRLGIDFSNEFGTEFEGQRPR